MAGRPSVQRLLKPAAYTAAITALCGTTYYLTSPSPAHVLPTRSLKRDHQGRVIPPKFPEIKSRQEQLAELRRHNTKDNEYDLLVIGGGATGTGIALDAVTRGLKVALVERDDFSSGTSSKSTKLVHGGVRYLEKAFWNLDYSQYELVREALRERKNFLYTVPHLSSWLPILLPLQKWWQAPYFWAGTKMYDLLAGGEGNPSSYYLTRRKALEAFPLLKKDNLVGALVYYDGQHNDSRMNMALATTAALYGATTVNHLEVTGLEKDSNGKVCGARLHDRVGDRNGSSDEVGDIVVRAKGIINATGPFADAINQMDEPQQKDIVAPSMGVHVMLPGHLSPEKMGLLDPSTSDGRLLFFLPWQGKTLAGTTDTSCSISKNPVPSEEDISWILDEVKGYLSPDLNLQRSDVLAAWAGIRPLVRDPNSKNTESVVRSHLVTVSKSGLLTCAGGKWTTYRQMAEDAVDKAIQTFNLKPTALDTTVDVGGFDDATMSDAAFLDGTCQTQRIRLIGAHGFSATLFANLIQEYKFDEDIARHLAENYGDRAWEVARLATTTSTEASQRLSPAFPFLKAEIQYAVENEYAQTAADVLARRTRLSFLNVQDALKSLPAVIDIMGDQLQWTEARRELEWRDTVNFLETMGLPSNQLKVTRDQVLNNEFRQEASATHRLPTPTTEQIPENTFQPPIPITPAAVAA